MPQIDTLWERDDPWKGDRQSDGRLGSVAVGRPSEIDEEDHFESFVARESIRFLEHYASSSEPFLLVSSFLKPHDPFMPAERFAKMFDPEKMQLSSTWKVEDIDQRPEEVRHYAQDIPWTPELKEAAEARKRMAYYYASLAQMDDCAGQVLSALKRLGLDRNTIVVYTSDHGEMLGDLGLWNKFEFYEGSCGVPLTFRMPAGAAALCEQPVSLISLASTLGDLCGVAFPGPGDGKSFAELVRDPASNWQYGPVFGEYNVGERSAKYMVRDGDYKYTHWVHDIDELYNLRSDPEEKQNLASQPEHLETRERLKRQLFAWHQPTEI
jgi:choline-sulfatase